MAFQSLSLYFLFITLFASNGINKALSAQIDISPDSFIEAVTDSIYISCSPDGTSARAKEILLMEIAKDGEKPITNIRQNSLISYGNGITKRFQAEGMIHKDVVQSYLNLTLLYPSSEDAGTYTCVMSYLDESGLLQQAKASGKLAVDRQNSSKTEDRIDTLETALDNLLDRVKSLEKENAQLQKDNKNQTQQINFLTDKVLYKNAFSAAVSAQTSIVNGMTIAFTDVIMQEGQGYNATSGVFVVPRAGLYAFHLVLEVGNGGTVGEISLMADANELAKLYTQDKDYGDQSSVSTVIELQPGVEVKVVVVTAAGSNPNLLGERLCVFTGYILKPL